MLVARTTLYGFVSVCIIAAVEGSHGGRTLQVHFNNFDTATRFKIYDKDHSGIIESAELPAVVSRLGNVGFAEAAAKDAIKIADADHDGGLTESEFHALCMRTVPLL